MPCLECGAEESPQTGRCPACGGQGPARVPVPASVTFDIGRLTRGDRIAGVGSLVVFIALLLPWYGTGLGNFTVDGLWHGWMFVTLLLVIATVGYLGLLTAMEVRLPITHGRALLVATALTLLLVVVGLLTTPSGAALQWGAIVALIGSLTAVAGSALARREAAIT